MADTKENILKIGDELMREKGFNAFSYNDIAKKLGIKNAAVHYHFPTKNDLLVAVTQFHIENFIQFKANVITLGELEQVTGFIDIYAQTWGQNRVCFVGAIATDWDTMDAGLLPPMQQMANEYINWLTNTLQTGLDKGTLQFAEEPRTKALLIITNMMAATQLARITDGENFITIKQAVIDSITPKN